MSNLSKHFIKNLQSMINILTDKKDNEEEDIEEIPKTSTQKQPSGRSFPDESNKPNKGKGKNTEDQARRKILPASKGGDDDSSSSSEEESD